MPAQKAAPHAYDEGVDALPYMSLPLEYAQPATLAAHAVLFGHRAPGAERARVLELGCASGGHIIPLAARFPDARFLGVDFDAREIETGQRRIAALGLANIELRTGDIATLSLPEAGFEYVICHGVFSWAPDTVRDAILRLAARTLVEDGVAAISFNVLPGWHVQEIVRDLCLHHGAGTDAPEARIGKVRAVLRAVAEGASGQTPYGLAMRQAAQRIATRPASYILGEFLAAESRAFFFEEFAAAAAAQGLFYLCDGYLKASAPEFFRPSQAALMRQLAGDDAAKLERVADEFTGRTFRRAILCKAKPTRRVPLNPPTSVLADLSYSCGYFRDSKADKNGPPAFRDAFGNTLRLNNAALAAALDQLAQIHPRTARPAELAGGGGLDRLCRNLFRLAAEGRVQISTLPLGSGAARDGRPVGYRVAREEHARGQKWVSTRQHRAVGLDADMRAIFAALDGSADHAALAALLRAPDCPPDQAQALNGDHAALPETAEQRLERALRTLERNALLEPG